METKVASAVDESKLMTADVAVVGAGFAGLTAAVRAQELGARVVVLEKSVAVPSWGNSRIGGGAFHAAALNILSSPEEIVRRVMEHTEGEARPDLVRAWAGNCARSLPWLKSHGARFIRWGTDPMHAWVMAPPRPKRGGLEWEGRGPDYLLRRLYSDFVVGGGSFCSATPARELIEEGGIVRGVLAVGVGRQSIVEVRAPAVILADGGFQANREMVERYLGPGAAYHAKLRATTTGTGDGIRMAARLGAKLVQMHNFYGHLLSRDALTNDMLWPFPQIDKLLSACILVAPDGARVLDEGVSGVFATNLLARSAYPSSAQVICDDAMWRGEPARKGVVGVNPNLDAGGGTHHRARTIAELAAKAGIDPPGLDATVARYNQAVSEGRGVDLVPPRSGSPAPIETPPFHAIPVIPALTFTMGGMAINGRAEVVNESEEPIAGLYACGNTSAGLDGGPRAFYTGGMTQCFVLGLIAGEAAVEYVRAR